MAVFLARVCKVHFRRRIEVIIHTLENYMSLIGNPYTLESLCL